MSIAEKIRKTKIDRDHELNNGNYAITKWLDKSDLPWLRAEEARLTKKNWDVVIEKKEGSHRLFVNSKNNKVKDYTLKEKKVTLTIYEGSDLYELRAWPESFDIIGDSGWSEVVIAGKDFEKPVYSRRVHDVQ